MIWIVFHMVLYTDEQSRCRGYWLYSGQNTSVGRKKSSQRARQKRQCHVRSMVDRNKDITRINNR